MLLSRTAEVFLNILYVLLLARVLTSWFRPRYRNRENNWFFQIDDLIWRATEPFLAPIRNLLPLGNMGIDFSPLILFFLIRLVGGWLVAALAQAGL